MTDTIRTSIQLSLGEGDFYAARTAMRRLLRSSANAATAQFILRCFQEHGQGSTTPEFKIAFLRSFTLEPVVPLLRAGAMLSGIRLSVQVSDFNTYSQQILDPDSELYQFDPELVVLAVQTRDLVPDLWYRYPDLSPSAAIEISEAAKANLASLIQFFRDHHRAHLIVHNLETPSFAAAGILDAQTEDCQTEAIRKINRALTRAALRTPGVYILDYDSLISRHGRLRWSDEQKWLSARMPISGHCLGHLAAEYLRFLVPLAGRTCKALAVDLDNTLWGGVVGEEGVNGIQLGPEFPGAAFLNLQRAILDLYRRGILLAVCSKNNHADAMEVLETHPHMLLRPRHFAAMRINWNDKSQNLREIAAELNIGIDALAFLDDSPGERELVGKELAEICVIDLPDDPMQFSTELREHPAFERLTLSAEDRERSRYYSEQKQRKSLEQQARSIEEFYRSLKIEVEISQVSTESLARTAQLTQKTNQFNLTTRMYTEQQIAEFSNHPDWCVYCLRSGDKFGDSGIVGVAMTRKSTERIEIETFLLSCRVIGRTIETALLAHLGEEALQRGGRYLAGWFLPTKKNAPAKNFYSSHGFTLVTERSNGDSYWEFDLCSGQISRPEWIRCCVTSPCLSNH